MEIKKGDVCSRLKLAREQIGLTQKQCAEYLNVGRAAYAKKETGFAQFSIYEIAVLSDVFGKSIEWILTGQNGQKKDVLTDREARLLGAFREVLTAYENPTKSKEIG